MHTITGITAADSWLLTVENPSYGDKRSHFVIRFTTYRIDDGPIVHEELSVNQTKVDGKGAWTIDPNQAKLLLPGETLVQVTASSWSVGRQTYFRWTDIAGAVEDAAFEDQLAASKGEGLNAAAPPPADGSITLDAFGGMEVELLDAPEAEDAQALISTAVENLIAAGPELRDSATSYVMKYYRSVREQFSDEECEDYGIPLEISADDLWDHVELRPEVSVAVNIGSESPHMHPQSAYLILEGRCSWEEEHGILLSYLNGERIARVSSFDGHPTNAAARANPELLDEVFLG